MHKHPNEGGCWFCHERDNREMWYSCEFDCDFHPECLHKELESEDGNPEAEIIAEEYGIPHNNTEIEVELEVTGYSMPTDLDLCEISNIFGTDN